MILGERLCKDIPAINRQIDFCKGAKERFSREQALSGRKLAVEPYLSRENLFAGVAVNAYGVRRRHEAETQKSIIITLQRNERKANCDNHARKGTNLEKSALHNKSIDFFERQENAEKCRETTTIAYYERRRATRLKSIDAHSKAQAQVEGIDKRFYRA